MKKQLFFLLLAIPAAVTCKKSAEEKKEGLFSAASSPDLTDYILFGMDDFDGTTLNTDLWDYRQDGSVRDGATVTSANVTVSNGTLKLYDRLVAPGQYTVSQISTEAHDQLWLKYGYYEIRAKLTSGVGTSCAFWLQSPSIGNATTPPNPSINGVEIDIFENGISQGPDKIFYSLHWNGYEPGNHQVLTTADYIPGIYSGFHTFALEWTPKKYVVYVDGMERASDNTAISHRKQFVILSNFKGGFGGSANPFPVPDSMEVDYIKVYRRKPEVTIYEHADYYGWTTEGLQPGSYTTTQLTALGFVNNQASSIEVPDGWRVVLYDGDDFTGDSLVVTQDVPTPLVFNDRTSSVRISN